MKVNVLVAASMVITSVSAAGKEGLRGCFRGICGSGSEAPFGLRVHPLFPKKRPAHDSNASQGFDPTKNKNGIVETPECVALSLILSDYQRSIITLSGKHLKSQFTILELQTKIDNSKPEKANKYRASQSLTKTTMEEIKGKAIILRKGYAEFWKDFSDEKCTDKSKQLSSPDKIGEIRIFIGDPMEPSNFDKNRETIV
ncbi:hypothetical protein BASA50_004335 [Batrachochytrium salamandrivorans]|uniref:Uncharacterized protein n=1 Tax=Batrachochytrium salamandrivorans TaxID=1357716 RepID=A0ABQ8FG48_9FUNG|nr:hypothetical protein BASA50_004335 [Batrachochytrium salamandrivorans]